VKSLKSLLAEIENQGLKVSECDPEIAKDEVSGPWFDVYRVDRTQHLQCFNSYEEAVYWAADYLGIGK